MNSIRRQSNEQISQDIASIGVRPCIHLYKTGAFSIASGAAGVNISFSGYEHNKKMTASGSLISFEEAGIYQASAEYRSTADVWNKWSVRGLDGSVKGESSYGGSGSNFPNNKTWLFTISEPGNYYVNLYLDTAGDSVAAPTPAVPANFGNTDRTLAVTITKVSDL